MKTIQFEDLKLPQPFDEYTFNVVRKTARAIFDQMKAHYEGKEQPTPEWRLPDPPPGQQWHRDDWTQDMLPEGYRPLLLGERVRRGDEWGNPNSEWIAQEGESLDLPEHFEGLWHRTRRPLPAPVEYVPLEPGDVPPGSAVRKIGQKTWCLILRAGTEHLINEAFTMDYASYKDEYEILRPGSSTWEPCKKVKQPSLDTKAG